MCDQAQPVAMCFGLMGGWVGTDGYGHVFVHLTLFVHASARARHGCGAMPVGASCHTPPGFGCCCST